MNRIVKKPEERRQDIISAAQELFLQQDYDNTSMKNIMDKLDIAKGTIYHYFKSKEELLDAVVEQVVEEYIEHLQDVLAKTTGDALTKMRTLMTAANVADEQAERLEQLHRPGNIAMHTRQLAVTVAKMAPLYAEVIQQGCDEGVFNTAYPLEAAEFLLAGIQFMTDLGNFPWREEDLRRRAAAIGAVLEAQLGAATGSFDFLKSN